MKTTSRSLSASLDLLMQKLADDITAALTSAVREGFAPGREVGSPRRMASRRAARARRAKAPTKAKAPTDTRVGRAGRRRSAGLVTEVLPGQLGLFDASASPASTSGPLDAAMEIDGAALLAMMAPDASTPTPPPARRAAPVLPEVLSEAPPSATPGVPSPGPMLRPGEQLARVGGGAVIRRRRAVPSDVAEVTGSSEETLPERNRAL